MGGLRGNREQRKEEREREHEVRKTAPLAGRGRGLGLKCPSSAACPSWVRSGTAQVVCVQRGGTGGMAAAGGRSP